MVSERQRFGARAEETVCAFLRKKGYNIIDRNYAACTGEIDIIASEGAELCFVEVKAVSTDFLPPELKVGRAKQRRIIKTAQIYLQKRSQEFDSYRFDVVTVTKKGIKHYRSAFGV